MGTKPKGLREAGQHKAAYRPDRLATRRAKPPAGGADGVPGRSQTERGNVTPSPFDDASLDEAPGFLEAEPGGVAPIEGLPAWSEFAEFDEPTGPPEPPEPPHCP